MHPFYAEMYTACFFVSLAMIAGLTYVVAPLASMFGCAVGLSDLMTAIVFVALGTSLPDTFASHQAAVEAPDADAAIGNVTGSNSVNVFLGAMPAMYAITLPVAAVCLLRAVGTRLLYGQE